MSDNRLSLLSVSDASPLELVSSAKCSYGSTSSSSFSYDWSRDTTLESSLSSRIEPSSSSMISSCSTTGAISSTSLTADLRLLLLRSASSSLPYEWYEISSSPSPAASSGGRRWRMASAWSKYAQLSSSSLWSLKNVPISSTKSTRALPSPKVCDLIRIASSKHSWAVSIFSTLASVRPANTNAADKSTPSSPMPSMLVSTDSKARVSTIFSNDSAAASSSPTSSCAQPRR